MFPKSRFAACAAVLAALPVSAPVALASADISPVAHPVVSGPSCPVGYSGPTNLATGCPYWMMTYTVEYPAAAPSR